MGFINIDIYVFSLNDGQVEEIIRNNIGKILNSSSFCCDLISIKFLGRDIRNEVVRKNGVKYRLYFECSRDVVTCVVLFRLQAGPACSIEKYKEIEIGDYSLSHPVYVDIDTVNCNI